MFGSRVNTLGKTERFDPYGVGGVRTPMVAAFDDEYYRSNGSQTTFSDLITHARSSNATMVDSDGLIKWAPHNLLTYSADLSQWTSDGVTIESGQVDSDGGSNAFLLYKSASGTGVARIYSDSVTAGAENKTSVWLKTSGVQWVFVAPASAPSGVWFDILNGVVGTENANYQGEITQDGDFYKVTVTDESNQISRVRVYLSDGDGDSNFTKNDTDGVIVHAPHLYRSDLGGMVTNPDRGDSYVPTTSSAVYLPRRGHHVYNGYEWVNEGVLAESEARTNLQPISVFSSTNWLYGNLTVLDANHLSPDGTQSAAKITATTNFSGLTYIYKGGATVSAGNNTVSAFVKVDTGNVFWLYCQSVANYGYAYFDLSDKTTQASSGSVSTPSNLTIEEYGSGWYRLSAVFNVILSSSSGNGVGICDAKGSTTVTAGKSGYVWGFQLETLVSTPSSYIPTNGSSVTRAAETLTIPSANLPWPTPQYISDELVTNGTFDTDTSGWAAFNSSTLSYSSGRLKITNGASLNGGANFEIATTAGKVYFVTGEYIAGTSLTGQLRIGTTIGGAQLAAGPFEEGVQTRIFVATGSVAHVNFINSLVATQYGFIDNVSVREINPLSVSIQMDGRMTYADDGDAISSTPTTGTVNFYSWALNVNNYIATVLDTEGSKVGVIRATQEYNSTYDSSESNEVYTPDILVQYNIASRNGSTFINGAVDGVALTADTTPTALPDLSSTDLSLAYTYMGTIKTFRIWDKDIGDTGIAEATS